MSSGYIPKPGDMVAGDTHTIYGAVTRFVQWFKPSLRKWRKWSHVAYVDSIDESGQIWVTQMKRHCERVPIQDVAKKGIIKVYPAPEGIDLERANAYAKAQVGIRYSYLAAFFAGVNLLTPSFINFDIQRPGTMMCSGYVAYSWVHGGWDCPFIPFVGAPAALIAALAHEGYTFQVVTEDEWPFYPSKIKEII